MAGLHEVPTDELLLFQDYTPVHNASSSPYSSAQINVDLIKPNEGDNQNIDDVASSTKSFWTLEYYQRFFDVDSKDVIERIIASMLPQRDNSLKNQIKLRPDLYGPFWISVTLIFTIAIGGNVANYLQHANAQYHWKYDFHLVSYAATAIFLYVTILPLALWGLLKWSSEVSDLDGLEDGTTPSTLELICVYGYSLFIYIPVSILWSIQIGWLQWLLVIVAAVLSGSVLVLTLMPSLRLSKYKLILTVGIITFHLLLAAGFMLYFFHVPDSSVVIVKPTETIQPKVNATH